MAGRWGPEGPPVEAYSRVTDPARYAGLGEHARAVVADLVTRFEVSRSEVTRFEVSRSEVTRSEGQSPPGLLTRPGHLSAVRLSPAAADPDRPAADLVVVWTDFPGLEVRAGRHLHAAFPVCGCDACDEDAADLAEEFELLVDDVLHGDLVEAVHTGSTGSSVRFERPDRVHGLELDVREPAGRNAWAPWPVSRG